MEDELRSNDAQEIQIAKEKSRLDLDSYGSNQTVDPFSPYAPAVSSSPDSPNHTRELPSEDYGMSSANLPLVGNSAQIAMATPYDDDDTKSYFANERRITDDAASTLYAPSAYMFGGSNEKTSMSTEKNAYVKQTSQAPSQTVETVKQTNKRRFWVMLTWMVTWWIPPFILSRIGRMKRPDVQMAWREKFTIK